MRNVCRIFLGMMIGVGCLTGQADAQFKNGAQATELNLPTISQRAVVTQRIGLTDITIIYYEPLVGGRELSYLGRLAVRPWSKLNLVAFGHLLESQGTGAYFRVTKSRGRGALRRERNCVSKDSGGEGAVELCVNCYRHA
jgi:hypothetical protein